jgi:hypothetical protein
MHTNDAILAFTDVLQTKISCAIEFPIPPPNIICAHSWGFVAAKQKSTNTLVFFPLSASLKEMEDAQTHFEPMLCRRFWACCNGNLLE